mgnify:CR=1 FL=1
MVALLPTTLMHNVDDIQTLIMQLENAPLRNEPFDEYAWQLILRALADSPCRLADARRRMMTAQQNCGAVSTATEP